MASFLDYYGKIRSRTLKVIRTIPAERLEWTFREGKYTIGDQVRHIATIERYMFAETFAGRPSCYQGCSKEIADGYDDVLDLFNKLHGETLTILRGFDDADLNKSCITPGNSTIPLGKWLRAMVEHEIHHRAQIYIYLSILDVPTPPIFGLTAEEVIQYSETV